MPKYLLLFLPFLWLTACVEDPGAGPSPVDIPELAIIVAEVQLADALASEVAVIVQDSMRDVMVKKTLASHGLDSTRFDSIMWVVRQEPEWLDALFTESGRLLKEWQTAAPTQ